MALSKKEFSDYIKQFNFRELFNNMGWNNDRTLQPIVVDNITFSLQSVAVKSGFKILLCDAAKISPPLSGEAGRGLPDYNTRKKIEAKVTKLFQEHLIIFFDAPETEQIWQLVVRQSGKPTKVTETRWHINQDPELLYQRAAGIFFELDEEEHITIIDVTKRIAQNFQQNNEKVTKLFYDKFKKEHSSFLQFIKGISDKTNQEWYASLMLNRLMFCYFIQKKGFLDNNKNYLRDKLKACTLRQAQGANNQKFYSFYRNFLLVLFHKGLNEPTQSQETKIEIGKIPYLNGGLFDEHELEKTHTGIDIDDNAFERLFDFFDQYEWHLDTRHTATGKDINPDVIGYIFEKYINDRANMGAYYTKEDITDYISKNCILPYLFDETKHNCAKAFAPNGEVWLMVKQSGDRYIYDAVKKGVELPLPENIEQGITDVSKRTDWNKPAAAEYALPTEIWREVVDRRKRYTEVKTKIDNGEITTINDFITYNLNIRQFAQDTVENTNDPELLRHFYKALNSVTIIDPTCGSGAFLFAAMNILESLYESCIMRMRGFTEDEDRENAANKKNFVNKYKFLRQILEETQNEQHPNLQYFIYKSIILRNLYGVDIMKEAVEIAKLRLFLKLVATVEADYRKPNLGLEPLPDIDFNIRAGNTLVGFATEGELLRSIQVDANGQFKTGYEIELEAHKEKCKIVANAFKRYKEIQLTYGDDFKEFKKAKEELNKRLAALNHELNQLLHKQASGLKYEHWLDTHQPFHWFSEFYEIINGNGGFDVVIGNPPYVELKGIKNYNIKLHPLNECGNLYAMIIYRSKEILNSAGKIGMIVPLSLSSSNRMKPLQKLISEIGISWISNYEGGTNPSVMFNGVKQNLSILICQKSRINKIHTSKIYRFFAEERNALFDLIRYVEFEKAFIEYGFPKISTKLEKDIMNKLFSKRKLAYHTSSVGKHIVYIHRIASYYIKCFNFQPHFKNDRDGVKKSEDYKIYHFTQNSYQYISIISSSIFYIYWLFFYDLFKAGKYAIENFPIGDFNDVKIEENLDLIGEELMRDVVSNSKRMSVIYKNTGNVEYDQYFPRLSKSIMDKADTALAEHYRFSDEELDFIINYDIKYRMGKELENEDEE